VRGLQGELQGIGQSSGYQITKYTHKKTECEDNEDIFGQKSIFYSMEELVVSFETRDDTVVAMDENRDCALVKMDENNLLLNTNHKLDHQIEQMIERNDGLWKCKVCGKTALKKNNIKSHA
jgi:hypothetical protein